MFRFCAIGLAAALIAALSVTAFATPRERPAPPPPAAMSAMVQGRVTLDGHDLPHGMALLVAEDGRIFNAPIHRGQFFLRAPAGTVRIAVHAPPLLPVHEPGAEDSSPLMLRMPANAGDPHTSGLGGTLIEGGQEVTLALQSQR